MRTIARPLIVVVMILGATAAHAQPTAADAHRATAAYRTGWEHMRAEQWENAAKSFQQAIAIDPKFTLAYYSLGRAQMGMRRFADAIQSYEKCRDLYLTRVGENYANEMERKRIRDEQIEQYNEALRNTNPVSAQASTVSLYQQHLRNELRQIQQANTRDSFVTIEPKVPFFVYLALGSAYFRSERFPDAEREYKAAIEAEPKAGEAHSNLAVLYLMTKRYDEAEKEVAAAEKVGFKVNPNLKEDIKKKRTNP